MDEQLTDTQLLLKLAQLMEPEKQWFGKDGVVYAWLNGGHIFPAYLRDNDKAFELMCEYELDVEFYKLLCEVSVSGLNHIISYTDDISRHYAVRKAIVLAVIAILEKKNA